MKKMRKEFIAALVVTLFVTSAGLIHILVAKQRPLQRPERIIAVENQPVSSSVPLRTLPLKPSENPGTDVIGGYETSVPKIWKGGRYSTRAGFSVELPAGAAIREYEQDPRSERGLARKVRVEVPSEKIFFSAVLSSSDFGVGIGEGCCDDLHGTLDLSEPTDEIRASIIKSFQEIYDLQFLNIDGRSAVRFISPFRYGRSSLVEHVLVPTGNAEYPTLHISSWTGASWGPDDAEPILDDKTVRLYGNKLTFEHLTRVLDKIKWIPIPAQ